MKKYLLSIGLIIVSSLGYSQGNNLSFGYVRTELEKSAVNLAVDYVKNLNPKLTDFRAGRNSLTSFTPDIKILVGSDDTFNGITAKYVGNIMTFKTTNVAGVTTPDLSKTFYNFPIALGIETNQDFSFVNGLVEAGFVPWYQNDNSLPKFIRQTKIGLFLQGGYKFAVNDTIIPKGGDIDQSKEKTKNALFRTKLAGGFSPSYFFDTAKSYGISLIGNGALWYDFLNSEVYYNIEGKLRLILSKDYFLDFAYDKGSGAPNFNEGEQFTTNLTIRF